MNQYRICIQTRANGTERITAQYMDGKNWLGKEKWFWFTGSNADWPCPVVFADVQAAKNRIDQEISAMLQKAGEKVVSTSYVSYP